MVHHGISLDQAHSNSFEKRLQIALGVSHSIELSEHGSVYTTGCGLNCQLGHGTEDNVTLFERVVALAADRVVFVAVGVDSSMVIGSGGNVLGFGRNEWENLADQ